MVMMMKMAMIRTMLMMMRMIVHKARKSCSTLVLLQALASLTHQLGIGWSAQVRLLSSEICGIENLVDFKQPTCMR